MPFPRSTHYPKDGSHHWTCRSFQEKESPGLPRRVRTYPARIRQVAYPFRTHRQPTRSAAMTGSPHGRMAKVTTHMRWLPACPAPHSLSQPVSPADPVMFSSARRRVPGLCGGGTYGSEEVTIVPSKEPVVGGLRGPGGPAQTGATEVRTDLEGRRGPGTLVRWVQRQSRVLSRTGRCRFETASKGARAHRLSQRKNDSSVSSASTKPTPQPRQIRRNSWRRTAVPRKASRAPSRT
jgi:hypothetical protein